MACGWHLHGERKYGCMGGYVVLVYCYAACMDVSICTFLCATIYMKHISRTLIISCRSCAWLSRFVKDCNWISNVSVLVNTSNPTPMWMSMSHRPLSTTDETDLSGMGCACVYEWMDNVIGDACVWMNESSSRTPNTHSSSHPSRSTVKFTVYRFPKKNSNRELSLALWWGLAFH